MVYGLKMKIMLHSLVESRLFRHFDKDLMAQLQDSISESKYQGYEMKADKMHSLTINAPINANF
jgi:hypothetical protein